MDPLDPLATPMLKLSGCTFQCFTSSESAHYSKVTLSYYFDVHLRCKCTSVSNKTMDSVTHLP